MKSIECKVSKENLCMLSMIKYAVFHIAQAWVSKTLFPKHNFFKNEGIDAAKFIFTYDNWNKSYMSLKAGLSQAIFSFIDANHRYIEPKSYTVSHQYIKPKAFLQMFECFVNSINE